MSRIRPPRQARQAGRDLDDEKQRRKLEEVEMIGRRPTAEEDPAVKR